MSNENLMIREVDKIIANLLIAEGAVLIPEVGSLRVVRHAAKSRVSRRAEPPYRTVEFTTQAGNATSLVNAIARAAGCPEEQAREIFSRWMKQVSHKGQLSISGVGQLKEQNFTPDPAFDRLLNPRNQEPVAKLGHSGHGRLWALVTVAVICGIGVCGWLYFDRVELDSETPITVVVPGMPMPIDSVDTVSTMAQTAVAETATPQTSMVSSPAGNSAPEAAKVADAGSRSNTMAQPVDPMEPQRLVSGRTYVVLGVYSTLENARRAVQEVKRQDPTFQASIYLYGPKFMISGYASDRPEEATAFMRRYLAAYPDIWTYRAR